VTVAAPAAEGIDAAITTLLAGAAEATALAVGVVEDGTERWVLGAPGPGAERRTIAWPDGRTTVLLAAPAAHVWALELAAAACRERARADDLAQQQEDLFEELGTSYESLSSIYEIGSDPSLLLSPERALAKIIDRALAFEADLKAVFWLVRGGEAEPAQWRNTERPAPRDAGYGLVGRALDERRGIIFHRDRGSEPGEPELRGARRIAISPLICRDTAIGALVVWHDAAGSFDSRLMGLLTSLSSQAAMILEQDRLRQETVEGERLRQEVEIGGTIQRALLLGHAPVERADVDVGVVAEASRQIDGDFIDFFEHGETLLDVLVADVMGKGIPAALVGAAVKSRFVRYASTPKNSGRAMVPMAPPQEIVRAFHEDMSDELITTPRLALTRISFPWRSTLAPRTAPFSTTSSSTGDDSHNGILRSNADLARRPASALPLVSVMPRPWRITSIACFESRLAT
jgi:GAF domain-containing protein